MEKMAMLVERSDSQYVSLPTVELVRLLIVASTAMANEIEGLKAAAAKKEEVKFPPIEEQKPAVIVPPVVGPVVAPEVPPWAPPAVSDDQIRAALQPAEVKTSGV
jgi:hypothetical protein